MPRLLRWSVSLLCIALLAGCGLSAGVLPSHPTTQATPSTLPVGAIPPTPTHAHPTATSGSNTLDPVTSAPPNTTATFPILSPGSHTSAVLRLQQLLAQQGYLPLVWQAKSATNPTPATSRTNPLPGVFMWAYPDIPSSMKPLWDPGWYTVMTEGAVMTFESAHGLGIDGIAGPLVWHALLQDAQHGKRSPWPYSYAVVSKQLPETFSLWEDGKIVLRTRTNTGIPWSPTPDGTWPVYLRFTSQTMSGIEPGGIHYSDPGVPWVSYFHGGDAVHGFVRAAYGYPQSLGCVELPVSRSYIAWQHMHYGTLVTVLN